MALAAIARYRTAVNNGDGVVNGSFFYILEYASAVQVSSSRTRTGAQAESLLPTARIEGYHGIRYFYSVHKPGSGLDLI